MMGLFEFGLEAVTEYQAIAHYGPLWLVEFRDYTTVIVISDPNENYIITPKEE